jgi:hypothetical protein
MGSIKHRDPGDGNNEFSSLGISSICTELWGFEPGQPLPS